MFDNGILKITLFGFIIMIQIYFIFSNMYIYIKYFNNLDTLTKARQNLRDNKDYFNKPNKTKHSFCTINIDVPISVLHETLEETKTKSREHEISELKCRILPEILLVGMEKCGTAALRTFLEIHPKIFIPQPLRPSYFLTPRYENLTLSEYYLQFNEEQKKPLSCTPDGMLRLEKIANGVKFAERAYQYIPNVKLIAIVREPIERALSHFVHFVDHDVIPLNATFEEAISAHNPYTRCPLYWSYYADRLQTWVDVYGAQNILILDGDEFVKDPFSALKMVEDFVGISNAIKKEDFIYNEEKKFYCVKSDLIGCMGNDKGRTHPEMRNETRNELQRYMKPLNEKFYRMIGRSFPWNY